MIPITAVVSTKNERAAIEFCIEQLRPFGQIIVVDSGSDDGTPDLARASGAEVVDYRWDGKYPKKKQWCLENLNFEHEWVLFVDADEYPSVALLDELLEISALGDGVSAVDIPLDYAFQGRRLQWGYKVVKRVLLKRGECSFPEIDDLDALGMGELEGHYQPVAERGSRRSTGTLVHEDPDPMRTWIDRHNRYSDWEAFLRQKPQVRRQVVGFKTSQGRVFDHIPLKPLVFFLYAYLMKSGWRDGRAGLDYAVALSFYYWLIDVKSREARRR